MEKARKKTNWLQIAGLFLFLVILPGGSWLYLRSGFQYRKASLAELVDRGSVGAFALPDAKGELFSSESLQGRVVVAGVLPAEAAPRKFWIDRMKALHKQFDERNELLILLMADSASVADPQAFLLENGLVDEEQWSLLLGGDAVAPAAFHLPGPDMLALTDTEGVVRRHYDIADNREMGRLIEHIAILLPRLPDPDIEFRRQKEK